MYVLSLVSLQFDKLTTCLVILMEQDLFSGMTAHSRTDSPNPSVTDRLICSSLLFVLTVEGNGILKSYPSGNTVLLG